MLRETALAGLFLLALPAAAQPYADLQCHKVKPDSKVAGLVDVQALEAGIPPSAGCRLKGPALLCVPVSGHNADVKPPPLAAGAPSGPQEIDHVCYRARCKGSPLPGERTVTDRFATYDLAFRQTRLLCTPALQGGPEPCGDSAAPQCGGACPVGRSCLSQPGTCGGGICSGGLTCSDDVICSICGGSCSFVPFCVCQ